MVGLPRHRLRHQDFPQVMAKPTGGLPLPCPGSGQASMATPIYNGKTPDVGKPHRVRGSQILREYRRKQRNPWTGIVQLEVEILWPCCLVRSLPLAVIVLPACGWGKRRPLHCPRLYNSSGSACCWLLGASRYGSPTQPLSSPSPCLTQTAGHEMWSIGTWLAQESTKTSCFLLAQYFWPGGFLAATWIDCRQGRNGNVLRVRSAAAAGSGHLRTPDTARLTWTARRVLFWWKADGCPQPQK